MSWLLSFASDSSWIFTAKLLAVAGVLGLLQHLIYLRCRTIILRWSRHSGWNVIDAERRVFRSGPFPFQPGCPVFLLTLKSSAGRRRQAFVQCGNAVMSVFSDHLAVEWTSEIESSANPAAASDR